MNHTGDDLARTTDSTQRPGAGAGAGLDATRAGDPALVVTGPTPGLPRPSPPLSATVAPRRARVPDLAATTAPHPVLDATTAGDASMSDAGAPFVGPVLLERGTIVGRYVVLDRLGAGAMGVVYAAFDPELDRKVALKLLQSTDGGASLSASADGRTRLFREAQALAKLSHPNVVGVFDVGTHGEQVWIAMELVEGKTLRQWLTERPRDWLEILAVAQAAGRGLAAAHAAGLVHRDVKPDNIMIGDDSRVRVMDFGLARSQPTLDPINLTVSTRGLLAADVTHAGSMVGTPAYMAPEQFRGGDVGPQADVFGFCVTIWECLHGQRPFAGATLPELRANVEAMRVHRPADGRAPRRLDAALLRGLAGDTRARWRDMPQLLAALDRVEVGVRRRRGLVLLGGGLALAAAIAGGASLAEQRKVDACIRTGATIDAEWSEPARAAMSDAFAATGKASAAAVFSRTAPWLDRWAAAWRRATAQVCIAGDVVGTLDLELRARAQDCLVERRKTFAALVQQLSAADALTLNWATAAAAALPPVEECTDPARLRDQPSPSPQLRLDIDRLRGLIIRASSLNSAGKFRDGLEVAHQAEAAARAIDWAPALAEAELRVAGMHSQLGEYGPAEVTLLRTLDAARAARLPRISVAALTLLVYVVGDRGTRFAEGKVWAEAARTELTHVSGDVRHLQAQLDNNLALVYHTKGDYAEARRLHERALAGWIAAYGPHHPQVGLSLNNLANATSAAGDPTAAVALHRRALAIRERALGPDHPFVAGSLSNLALALQKLGRRAESLHLLRRALDIRERALGDRHPDFVESLISLAGGLYEMGEFDEALALYRRALATVDALPTASPMLRAIAYYNCGNIHNEYCRDQDAVRDLTRSLEIFESAIGKDHPTLAYPLTALARARARLGQFDEARRFGARALAIVEAAFGPQHPALLNPLLIQATIERSRGDAAEALRLDERALAILAATSGLEDADAAEVIADRAITLAALNRHPEAIAALQRALALRPPDDRTPITPTIRFALARALWDSGGDRRRARALAERALAEHTAHPVCARNQDEIRAWLTAHPG